MKGLDYMKNISVHGRIKLKWILKKWGGRMWDELIWFTIGTSDGLF
jgi:hypothetical protein